MNSETTKKIKKIKTVRVNTPNGIKTVSMAPITLDTTRELSDVICTECCPYGKLCGSLRHPEFPDDNSKTLNDWCVDVSFVDEKKTEINDLGCYYPISGELENLYPEGSDSLKQIMNKNPIIRLNEFIDKVCSGFCDQYNPEHSNCTFKNQTCICKELLLKTEEPMVLNSKCKKLSDDSTEESSLVI